MMASLGSSSETVTKPVRSFSKGIGRRSCNPQLAPMVETKASTTWPGNVVVKAWRDYRKSGALEL